MHRGSLGTMKIAGVEVSGSDGRTLFELLHSIGRDADLALAHRIERGFSRQVEVVTLSPAERDLVLSVLNDPSGTLAELRDCLARDRREQ